jgi:hypothetical protein
MAVSNLDQERLRPFANLNQHYEPRSERGVTPPQFTRENSDANEVEAGIRGDGSGEAAGDCEQGRQGESRGRTQGEQRSLITKKRARRT